MVLFLTVLCIFGGFILRWRHASLTGYFGSPANIPGIFKYGLGNLIVSIAGNIAYWGAALLLLLSDWRWAAIALFLGFVLRAPMLLWVCGPSKDQGARSLRSIEVHYRVTFKKHIRWSGRFPITEMRCDFVAPAGTVVHDWVSIKFPPPFGEYAQEERFYSTVKSEEFEQACKASPLVLGYCRVDQDVWRKTADQG